MKRLVVYFAESFFEVEILDVHVTMRARVSENNPQVTHRRFLKVSLALVRKSRPGDEDIAMARKSRPGGETSESCSGTELVKLSHILTESVCSGQQRFGDAF